MSHYHDIITEAVGPLPAEQLAEIEDIMRQDIFHSTLDWQTREQLKTAAVEARDIMLVMARPEGLAMIADMKAAA